MYLFEYLDKALDVSGRSFQYIAPALAFLFSLLFNLVSSKIVSIFYSQVRKTVKELEFNLGQNEAELN
jgi:hypothetical protein